MKALVKTERKPGIWLQDVPIPKIGPNDLLIKVRKAAICGTDVHIYNWDAWAQKTIPVPADCGARVHRRGRRGGIGGRRLRQGGAGQRRGARHLRPLPQLPSRQAPSVPQHRRHWRSTQWLLRRIPGAAGGQRLPSAEGNSGRDLGLLRSAGQRRPHRPELRSHRARTCSSPAPAPSAAWPRPSPATWGRGTWSSPTSTTTGWRLAKTLGASRAVNVANGSI